MPVYCCCSPDCELIETYSLACYAISPFLLILQYEPFLIIYGSVFSRHQTHYEQFGDSEGTLDIEGHGSYELKIKGLRDHSYGE